MTNFNNIYDEDLELNSMESDARSVQTFETSKSDENIPVLESAVMNKPDFSSKSIKNYCKTRFTELIPNKQHFQANKHLLNPLPGLRLIGRKQWLMFLSAFLAWTWDAYDFFSVSLNTAELAKDFDRNIKDITWGITVILMLRSVGGFFFGYLGDRYGRKWPLIANLLCVCVLEIGTGFITTYEQFLAVRALFGIMLGGVYGNATATALDDCPTEARGFISGLLQQGYAFGYILAVIFKRAIADNSKHGWRAMFWFGSGVCFLIASYRSFLPETKAFQRQKEIERYNIEHGIYQMTFTQKLKEALKIYWLMIIYCLLLVIGFSFMSHGSQDLYPVLLTVRYEFSENASTVTNCVANLGAITGGVTVGHLSNFAGRRLCIMICCICGGALIYPWAFVGNANINAGAFFLQFMVQGAWGVMPVHLSELAPPDFRSFVVGIAYQLGNLVSSASTTIETTIGEQFPIISPSGAEIYDYSKVMAIVIGAVFAYNLVVTFIGPEHRNQTFDQKMLEEFEVNEKVTHEEVEEQNVGYSMQQHSNASH